METPNPWSLPMHRTPSKRLPRGLLAAAALDALEQDPRPGAAVLDRLLPAGSASDVRLPAAAPIHLRRIVLESEWS
jgi:hypothetical protein